MSAYDDAREGLHNVVRHVEGRLTAKCMGPGWCRVCTIEKNMLDRGEFKMSAYDDALDKIRVAIEMQLIAYNESDPGVIANAVAQNLSKAGYVFYYQP